jgi:hypothetical protein
MTYRLPHAASRAHALYAESETMTDLYLCRDAVRPDQQNVYNLFCEGFLKELVPDGAMENLLAAEIIQSAWRLRNCTPEEDRIRAQAFRQFKQATAELRRMQTERQLRHETLPEDFDADTLGLASCKEMAPILKSDVRRQLLLHKLHREEMSTAVNDALFAPLPTVPAPPPAPSAQPARPESPASSSVPRSAACPCGSGSKYKRCCGVGAPAVLSRAAA